MRRTQDLRGRLALITGAGRGIGAATAHALAAAGCRVVATDVDGDAAEKTALACTEHTGNEAWSERLDVTDALAVGALAERLEREQGPLDIVVANAGVGMSGRFESMTLDDWRWIRDVNLDGVVHTVHAFGRPMLQRGSGHVVVVSSAFGYTTRATEPGYVTTKAAVLAFARCLAADWRPRGVGVTAVCPGLINTPIIDHTRFLGDQDDRTHRRRAERLFRRGHKPSTVGKAIVKAIEKNRVVAPAGWEARLGWWAHRFTPIALEQFIARQGPRP